MLVTISSFPFSWSRSLTLRLISGGRGPVCGGRASVVSGGADRPGEQLRDVDDFEGVLGLAGGLLGADGVAEHDQAVGAGGGDGVRGQGQGLLDPLDVDPLADALFHPHPGPAGAAAPVTNAAWERQEPCSSATVLSLFRIPCGDTGTLPPHDWLVPASREW